MNSKSEWRGHKISRLTIQKSDKDLKKQLETADLNEQAESVLIQELKTRVDAHAQLSTVINDDSSYRKRKMAPKQVDSVAEKCAQVPKRQKVASVVSKHLCVGSLQEQAAPQED